MLLCSENPNTKELLLREGIFVREEHLVSDPEAPILLELTVKKPAVQASKDLDLKAIYSRSLKSAKSLRVDDGVELYSDDSGAGKGFDDVLKHPDIQAVIIACVTRINSAAEG